MLCKKQEEMPTPATKRGTAEPPMAMYDYYDDISKFLHERDIADCLEDSEELDVIKYAKTLIKNIDNYSVAFRE